MYKLIYFSDFKDINDVTNRIEIYKDTDYTVKAKELLLNSEPVKIDYEGEEDIYKPLKMSSCSVNILTNEVLSDLYTGKLNEIMLKVFKGNSLYWMGYLTPNIYNSEYNSEFDLLTLEFIDCIAQLENTKFIKSESLITSFYDLITRVIDKVDKAKVINHIYFHNSITINGKNDVLNNIYIQERNFYDEEDEPETNKTVLEDMFQYLGMSLIQYLDSFYVIDYDALQRRNFTFIQYNRQTKASTLVTLPIHEKKISEVGIHETSGNISLGDVYNKINIIAVNNPIEMIIPELFDKDSLTNQNVNPNKYYEETIGKDDKATVYLSAYFNSSKWKNKEPKIDNLISPTIIKEVTLDNVESINEGTFFQKNDSYLVNDGEPSSLSWSDAFTMASGTKGSVISGWEEWEALSTSVDYVVYKRGYFIIDFNYLFNNSHYPNYTEEDNDIKYRDDKYVSSFHNTMFMCRLKIGDYYYDGEGWRSWSKDYLPNKDIYENAQFGTEMVDGVSKTYYIYKGKKTYITEDEYLRMKTGDKFYLVHKNKVGDKIYNTWKRLTNQVSYKMNLIDSEDGVLVKLPEFVVNGKLEFSIYCPNDLGNYANPRTENVGKYGTWVRYCHIKDLKLIYTNDKHYIDTFNKKEFDPDVLYTNVIDNEYVTELDDINLRVNTYTDKASSWSYVIYKLGDNKYDFVEKVHNKNINEDLLMEECLIRKYVSRYSQPKFIYSNDIINKDIKPYSILNVMNRRFIPNKLSYDLANNSVIITMIEL